MSRNLVLMLFALLVVSCGPKVETKDNKPAAAPQERPMDKETFAFKQVYPHARLHDMDPQQIAILNLETGRIQRIKKQVMSQHDQAALQAIESQFRISAFKIVRNEVSGQNGAEFALEYQRTSDQRTLGSSSITLFPSRKFMGTVWGNDDNDLGYVIEVTCVQNQLQKSQGGRGPKCDPRDTATIRIRNSERSNNTEKVDLSFVYTSSLGKAKVAGPNIPHGLKTRDDETLPILMISVLSLNTGANTSSIAFKPATTSEFKVEQLRDPQRSQGHPSKWAIPAGPGQGVLKDFAVVQQNFGMAGGRTLKLRIQKVDDDAAAQAPDEEVMIMTVDLHRPWR